jgi:hypothetical protein
MRFGTVYAIVWQNQLGRLEVLPKMMAVSTELSLV